jgi:hypothetical protein
MSDNGLEPLASGGEKEGRRASPGTGFGDKKKVAIMIGLGVIALGVVAYEFLGGKGPTRVSAAVAVVPGGAGGSAPVAPKDVDTVLKQLDKAVPGNGEEDLTVDRIEQLVKQFDGYVRERQVPVTNLRGNPFAVQQPPPSDKETSAAEAAETKPDKAATEAEARKQRIRDEASRLVLGSVLVAGERRMAILSGKLCRVGDVVGGFRVDTIDPDRVRVSSEGETFDLHLKSVATAPDKKGK